MRERSPPYAQEEIAVLDERELDEQRPIEAVQRMWNRLEHQLELPAFHRVDVRASRTSFPVRQKVASPSSSASARRISCHERTDG